MQALIDFDGWRKWKDFANDSDTTAGTSKLSTSYSSIAPRKGKSPTNGGGSANGLAGSSNSNGVPIRSKDEDRKGKRKSMGVIPPPVLPEEDSQDSAPKGLRPGPS
jgi:osomolarity two-component system response regulator SSK1